jgi:hypothetical protein
METTVPATCSTASSELHHTTSAKFLAPNPQWSFFDQVELVVASFSIISSLLDVKDFLLRWSSSSVSCPFLNQENHS